MPVSATSLIERIARVLAGQHYSSNAAGEEASASEDVDLNWEDFLDDADAVLRTMREPDAAMAEGGDAEIWKRMVDLALTQSDLA